MRCERENSYRVVDVFTRFPLEGNALAVFSDAGGMDEATMQRVARELNLAETAFVLPTTRDGCAARVRIFTPTKEMIFAGHPTIGTGFVLLGDDPSPKVGCLTLDELVGPVPVRVEFRGQLPMLWLTTPPTEFPKDS
jgi:trans-2,3-dihydro-3-hydroxyanthranilate isomerase